MRMDLWFDCDDDLTLEAERMVTPAQRPGERIPARPHGWFHHLRKFEMEGIRGFKVDPYAIMNVHHGRKYFNGKRDLEMHNLTQSLLAQQMYEGAAAGGAEAPRIMTQYSGIYIGTQRWVANTMDDDAAGPGTLCWMLNLGLTGNSNTTADMTPDQGAAVMQMAFFSGWTDIQSWCSSAEPWLYSHHVQAVFRYYDDLRHRLLPYIYSTAWHATQSGIPIMRAMPLMFPGSLECANLTHQYMFGRDFLVAVFTHRVYLPKGQWFNYWTGRSYTGGRWVTPTVPTDRGGPLFVRAGAIVPMWPVVQYVCHVPESRLFLAVWPHGTSHLRLYEDDGTTYEYLHGQYATTRITCSQLGHGLRVTIHPQHGRYGLDIRGQTTQPTSRISTPNATQSLSEWQMAGYDSYHPIGWGKMPQERTFMLRIHAAEPKNITVNGRLLPSGAGGWLYAPPTGKQATGVISLSVMQHVRDQSPITIRVH